MKVQPEALSEDDVFHQISTGKGYMHTSLDNFGRPVLVVKVAKHFAGQSLASLPVLLLGMYCDPLCISFTIYLELKLVVENGGCCTAARPTFISRLMIIAKFWGQRKLAASYG